jgi:hypothetical protein
MIFRLLSAKIRLILAIAQLLILWIALVMPFMAIRSCRTEYRFGDHGALADLLPITRGALRETVGGKGVVTLSFKTPDDQVHQFRNNVSADTLTRLETDPGQVQYLPEDPDKTARLAGNHERPLFAAFMAVLAWAITILWLVAAQRLRRQRRGADS